MKTMAALRKWANADGPVAEDVACKGTALESTSFKLGGKAFLFVQPKPGAFVVRLKLGGALTEAKRLGYDVGANGWVKGTLGPEDPPPVLAQWIGESRALTTKGAPAARAKRTSSTATKPKAGKQRPR